MISPAPAPETTAASDADAPSVGLRERLSDRLSPVLVKEVRQALRGRYFTVIFWLTLSIATFASVFFLVFGAGTDPGPTSGPSFFLLIYGCLSVAVHLFVPFSAHLSLVGERDENAYDLLVLSNLRPRQILAGKLLACGIQVLLYYSAFLPFLAFAFLLPGLDLGTAGWVLFLTLFSAAFVSLVALALATPLLRLRVGRSFVMAVLAVGLVPAAIAPIAVAQNMLAPATPSIFGGETILAIATVLILLGAQLFAYSCARLAHVEENRASALRAVTSTVVAVVLVWIWNARAGITDPRLLTAWLAALMVFVGIVSIPYASEPERLGRRVRLQVPRRRWLAVLALPWLPGGARGFVHFLLHLFAIAVFGLVLLHASPAELLAWARAGLPTEKIPASVAGTPEQLEAALVLLIPLLYLPIYLGLPTALFARPRAGRWRALAGVSVPLFAFLGFLLPTLAGYFADQRDLMEGRHLGNPFLIPMLAFGDDGPVASKVVLVASVLVLVLLLNLPRVVRSIREVRAWSDERRRLEARRAEELPVDSGEHALPDA